MSCDTHADALMGHLYGELTPPEDKAFLDHVRTCAACTQELAALGGLQQTLARSAPLPDPPEALTFRIMEAARKAAAEAPATAPALASSQTGGLLGWLLKPWTMGLALAGAAAAGLLVVGTSSFQAPKDLAPATAAKAVPAAAPPEKPAQESRAGSKERADPATYDRAGAAQDDLGATALAEPSAAGARGDAPEPARARAGKADLASAGRAEEVQAADKKSAAPDTRVTLDRDGAEDANEMKRARKQAGPADAPAAAPAESAAAWGLLEAKKESAPRAAALEQKSKGGAAVAEVTAESEQAERAPAKALGMDDAFEKRKTAAAPAYPATPQPLVAAAPAASPPPPAQEGAAQPLAKAAPGGGAPPREPAAPSKPQARTGGALYGAPLSLPSRPQNAAPVGSTRSAPAADEEAPEADPLADRKADGRGFGAAGNSALALPKAREEARRQEENPTARALAKDARTLKETDTFMRAQMELSVGADMLATREYPRALEAFRRAQQLDVSRKLAPGPALGEAVTLARMGNCTPAADAVAAVARSHPKYFKRVEALEEVATCHEQKGDKAASAKVRAEAAKLRKSAGSKLATPEERAQRASSVMRSVREDSRGLGMCERAALQAGELPAVAGGWRLMFNVDERGNAQDVTVRGPRPAPALERCLRIMVGSRRYQPGPDAELPVEVTLMVGAEGQQAPGLNKKR